MAGGEAGNRVGIWTRLERPGVSSLLLFCGLSIAYLLILQEHPYGDGITYLDYLLDGKLAFHHLLYLPTLWLFSQLGSLFGITVRTSAFAWSALAAAGAVSTVYYLLRTARTFRIEIAMPAGRAWVMTLLIALLVATAPSVLFYATQLENHANHLLWVSLFFLVLDRSLASLSPAPWILSGLVLTGAYASHSSILLLFPAILLLVHYYWNGPRLRLPEAPEILRLLLLFLPTLGFKYLIEPWIKGLQGDPNLAGDFGQDFALKLMEFRSAGWLASYFLEEVLFAAFGLWVLFFLFQLGKQDRRFPAACVMLGLLSYYLLFAHWPVRERGAYFLPLLPFAALALGKPLPLFQRFATPILLTLILSQATLGYRALRTHDRARGPWRTADLIASTVSQNTIVLCRSGVVQLHLKLDHHIDGQALENWMIGWAYSAKSIPRYWEILIETEILPKIDGIIDSRPLYLTQAGSEVLSADPGAAKILTALQKRYRFEARGEGASAGWMLHRRD